MKEPICCPPHALTPTQSSQCRYQRELTQAQGPHPVDRVQGQSDTTDTETHTKTMQAHTQTWCEQMHLTEKVAPTFQD